MNDYVKSKRLGKGNKVPPKWWFLWWLSKNRESQDGNIEGENEEATIPRQINKGRQGVGLEEQEDTNLRRLAIIAWLELTAEEQNTCIARRKSDNEQRRNEKAERMILFDSEQEVNDNKCKGVTNSLDRWGFSFIIFLLLTPII